MGESVKAFVVLKHDTNVPEEEIIETAKVNLASYQKQPSIEIIDKLPKTPTGKILKQVLRDLYWVDQEKDI